MSAPLSVLSELLGDEQAQRALSALSTAGYICVPREPIDGMLEAAWEAALAEDAEGVWKSMLEAYELASK